MPKALIVDDSPAERRLAGTILEEEDDLTVLYASEGVEALAVIEEDPPDVVITDLRMPKMGGLDLVKEIRTRHNRVPVILMTSFGSEDIAAEALRRGASSYVPKRNLMTDLRGTVERVIASATRAHRAQAAYSCLEQTESRFVLHNDSDTIGVLVGHLQECIVPIGLSDEAGCTQIGIALEEAIRNAVYHGNLEVGSQLREDGESAYEALAEERRTRPPYRDRRAYVTAEVSPAQATYIIRDEGPGFNPAALPDPTDPNNLGRVSGRGLLLMRTFMSEVSFNETGNEVTMVKRRDGQAG